MELKSPVTGSVWMQAVSVGQEVFAGTQILVIESMKMEVPIETPVAGIVVELAQPGTTVEEGTTVAVIEVKDA